MPRHLPPPAKGRTLVIGAGKAAAAMAACLERHWPAAAPIGGRVITRHGHACPTRHILVVEAGHPLPDEHGRQAAAEIMAMLATLGPEDMLIGLISGGGSSLLSLPVPGVSLADLRQVMHDLLNCGAAIQEINIVRKHLSISLGGRLAAATRARVRALIISDVAGDDPASIASGPFAPDPSTFADALDVLRVWRVAAPPAVLRHLEAGAQGRHPETPKPGDSCFVRVENTVIASGRTALLAAAQCFRERGITPVIMGDAFTTDASALAEVFATLALETFRPDTTWQRPLVLLSGGECTVKVDGTGAGGRNGQFALALATALAGHSGIYALAADTDGIDGTEANAGVLLDPGTMQRAQALGLNCLAHLRDNNSHGFFHALGDLLVTGPTLTNVNDYRAILII